MANIGTFRRVEDGTISGEIRTLRFKTSARFVPVEDKTSEQAPDFRLFAPGKVELGAAWKKVSDDIGFPAGKNKTMLVDLQASSTIRPSRPRSTQHSSRPRATPTGSTSPGPARASRTTTGTRHPATAPGRKGRAPLFVASHPPNASSGRNRT